MKYLHIKTPYFLIAIILLVLCSTNAPAAIKASYMYTFSNFTGRVSYSWAGMSADRERGEIYAIYQGSVSVFNSVGMEIYQFGDDTALGHILDVAPEQDGRILLLSSDGTRVSILRCNYRGELKETLEIKGVPPNFSLRPQRIVSRKVYIYLADLSGRQVVVTDSNGAFVDGYDIGAHLAKDEKPGTQNDLLGFSVDSDGNMLFTVPTIFLAFRMSRDHKVESFGGAGNLPGKFNVAGAIASDDKGFIYVADILKSVVMIFDKDFNFQMQFGHRGNGPDNLTIPMNIEVIRDKLFVNQARNKGVSVFRVAYN